MQGGKMEIKPIEIRVKKVKEFVSKYKHRANGVRAAVEEFGFCESTIYNYLKM